ncbi:isocitrate lyase/phosphoenolpyruvate mutase family protein [Lysobacter korlensis]|uniref:Isocitrate lyase/phosphoenolpyruvate mutase family protein n=1 Tax=Lysobacter korlensis TaxID=553636 RepID=A0ABV6RTC0_9GAMM
MALRGMQLHSDIGAVASGTTLPLNVMAMPGLPTTRELETLGVRRLSTGTCLAEAALGRVAALAARFLEDGSLDGEHCMPYADANALFDSNGGTAG